MNMEENKELPTETKADDGVIDVTPTDGQVKSKVYRYIIKTDDIIQRVSVFASCSTVARGGIGQMFPNSSIAYDGMSDNFMHIQG